MWMKIAGPQAERVRKPLGCHLAGPLHFRILGPMHEREQPGQPHDGAAALAEPCRLQAVGLAHLLAQLGQELFETRHGVELEGQQARLGRRSGKPGDAPQHRAHGRVVGQPAA